MKNKVDLIITNASEVVTLAGKAPKVGKEMSRLGIINRGGIAIKDKRIVDTGESVRIERLYRASQVFDVRGKVVTPGLIDPHTHLVFAGTRENEFEMRIKGKSYMEIAKAKGGINSTVKSVRKAQKVELKELARSRLEQMIRYGTTTAEVKSGYGLSLQDEIRCLEVVKELSEEQCVDLIPTFLGAHSIPQEYKNSREGYIKLVVEKMLPEIVRRKLARFCDVFCEKGAFGIEESRYILTEAKKLGLLPKLHADEFTDSGGALLAGELKAVSADHLCYTDGHGIKALGKNNVVAVLLPGTTFFLGGTRFASARKMIEMGVPVALGSDFNPGSCMTFNMQLIMTIACCYLRLTPAEALTAVTINSACALREENDKGSLEPGKIADIVIWNVVNFKQIPYQFGGNLVHTVIKEGGIVLPSN